MIRVFERSSARASRPQLTVWNACVIVRRISLEVFVFWCKMTLVSCFRIKSTNVLENPYLCAKSLLISGTMQFGSQEVSCCHFPGQNRLKVSLISCVDSIYPSLPRHTISPCHSTLSSYRKTSLFAAIELELRS